MNFGEETPRQRMIGILYLVLLALLALSVPDTILNAFKTIDNSLETSKSNVNNSVEQLFTAFEQTKLKEDPIRAQPFYDKAKNAQSIIKDLNVYIDSIKTELTLQGGGIDDKTGDLVNRDNEDILPNFMINQKNGEVLKKRINDTKTNIISLLTPEEQKQIIISLDANDPTKSINGKSKWEDINFGSGTPLTGGVTLLTKIQSDAQNTEADVIKLILGKMDQSVVNLDRFTAVAVAPTSYLIQGQPYIAEVFLTASDSKSDPSISVNGTPLKVVDGKGTYSVATNKEGVFSWQGLIKVKQTDGSYKDYRTVEQKYQVSRPSAVVSPDKMNVFYIGVDNPISVSAAGIPNDKVKVQISNGTITGANGKYNVKVNTVGNTKISVLANSQTLSTTDFRIKRIPDPIAQFGGKTGGTMPSQAIKAQNTISAKLVNFDFEATFKVTKFTLIIAKPRADVIMLSSNDSRLTPAMTSALNTITPGTRVIFDNIIAVGPDGIQRQLNAIALSAN